MKIVKLGFLLLLSICAAECAKILGVFHVASYSHYVVGNVLLKELAKRGHEVTMISAFEEKNPPKNYKTIVIHEIAESKEKIDFDPAEMEKHSIFEMIKLMSEFTYDLSNATLANQDVQKLLKSNEKFDVVIIEQFMDEALRGFQYHFKAPCIIFSTIGSNGWSNPLVGNPENPAYMPETMSNFPSSYMTFMQRLQNTFMHIFSHIIQYFYMYSRQNALMQKYFPGAPDVRELLYNTSFILLNSHVSYSQPKPHLPNMIEVGGLHISPPGKLPADLQKYLDDAKEGVIYFSLGSNIKSKSLQKQKLEAITNTFAKLKMQILWKWESETMSNQPRNVKLGKWLPQQEILAHPNVKLFITHGGLLSTIETVYHGKPVMGIPFFGDQKMNMQIAVANGYGVRLDYQNLTEATFAATLNEALSNPSYTENVKLRSRLMHDRPMKPLDSAAFWVEYVIRHKGAYHLRSSAMNLKWYQLLLLDVIAAVVVPLLAGLFTLIFILKMCCCRKSSSTKASKKVTQQKKKN